MKKMRELVAFCLAVVLCFAFTACVVNQDQTTTTTTTTSTTTTTTTTTTTSNQDPTPDPEPESLEYTLNEDGESYSVTGIGTCTDADIVIPETYNDLPVTSIGNGAFEGCTSLSSVEIPDSVTSIGDGAFEDCTSLSSVEIPDSVTSIGNGAFYICESLTSIDIPDRITSIGRYAFFYCTSLTSIEIPDSVTSIGEGVFRFCTGLTSIDIPDSVTSIDKYVFGSCTSLTSINYSGMVAQWLAITKASSWDSYTSDYTVFCTDGTVTKPDDEQTPDPGPKPLPEGSLVVADLKFDAENEAVADGFTVSSKGGVVVKDGALKVENSHGGYFISDDNLVLNYENYESITFSMKFKFDSFSSGNMSLISPLFCDEEHVTEDNPDGYIYQMFLKVNSDGGLYYWKNRNKWIEPITFNGETYKIQTGVTYDLEIVYNIEFGSYEIVLNGITLVTDSLTTVMDDSTTGFDIRIFDANTNIGAYSVSIEDLKIVANPYPEQTPGSDPSDEEILNPYCAMGLHTVPDDAWEVERAATCRIPLVESGVCIYCGEEIQRKGEKLDHDWEEIVIEEATCLKPGVAYHKCSMCGLEEKLEDLPLAEHDYTETTDSTGKYVMYDCSVCGANYVKNKPTAKDLLYWTASEVSYEGLATYSESFTITPVKGLDYYTAPGSNNTVIAMPEYKDNSVLFINDKNNALKDEDSFVIQFDIMYEKFPEGSKPSTLVCLPVNNQADYLFFVTVDSNGYLGFTDEKAYETPIKDGQLSLNTWHNVAVVVRFGDAYMQANSSYIRIPYDVYLDGEKLTLECEINGETYVAECGTAAANVNKTPSISEIKDLMVRIADLGRNVGLSYRFALDNIRIYTGTEVDAPIRGELDFGAAGKITLDYPTTINWNEN